MEEWLGYYEEISTSVENDDYFTQMVIKVLDRLHAHRLHVHRLHVHRLHAHRLHVHRLHAHRLHVHMKVMKAGLAAPPSQSQPNLTKPKPNSQMYPHRYPQQHPSSSLHPKPSSNPKSNPLP